MPLSNAKQLMTCLGGGGGGGGETDQSKPPAEADGSWQLYVIWGDKDFNVEVTHFQDSKYTHIYSEKFFGKITDFELGVVW